MPARHRPPLQGKKGLILGIANDTSIAYGCAQAFRRLGAELAITYLNEEARPHVQPLAEQLEAPIFLPCDVLHEGDRDAIVCGHCGAVLRGRYFVSLGPDDVCWYCHFHLHRCDNCRYFDQIACLLDLVDRHEAVPGQHCPAFSYLPMRAASVGTSDR